MIFIWLYLSMSSVFAITTDQFPYQASLHSDTLFLCSGAILSPKWILTSASCFSLSEYPTLIRVGSSVRNTGGQTSKIENVYPHPKFTNKKRFTNDVALVKLRQRIYFDSRAKPIKMAEYELPVGARLDVIGWGPHANLPNYNVKLLSALSATTVDQAHCNATMHQLSRHFIADDDICTGGNAAGFCQENLGALLATRDGKLFGIATWMQICNKTVNYDLFVNVLYHHRFISSVMDKV